MDAPAQPEPTVAPPAEEDAGGRMSFFEHLLDLRKRLIYSAAAIAVGAGIGLLVSKHFIVIPWSRCSRRCDRRILTTSCTSLRRLGI